MDPLKIYMYAQKLFNAAVSLKTIQPANPTLQKVIDYALKIKRISACCGHSSVSDRI